MKKFPWFALIGICSSLVIVSLFALVTKNIAPSCTLAIFPEFIDSLHPERDILFYIVFCLTAISIMAALGAMEHWSSGGISLSLLYRLGGLSILTAIVMTCIYMKQVDVPGNFPYVLLITCSGFILTYFFLSLRLMIRGPDRVPNTIVTPMTLVFDAIYLAVLFAIIWVPDPAIISAYAFMYDHNLHADTFVMTPALVSYLGGTPNIDVFSFYGASLPAFLAWIAHGVGGLTYELWSTVYVAAIFIFYALVYIFFRLMSVHCLASFALTAGAFWAQCLHESLAPFPLNFPSGSVLRYFYFIPTAICLLFYSKKEKRSFLSYAAVLTGISMTHFWDTGIYQYIALSIYALAVSIEFCVRPWKVDWLNLRILMTVPLITMLLVLWIVSRGHCFSATYWVNSFDQIWMTQQGWLANPVNGLWLQGNVWHITGAFLFPALYVVAGGFLLAHFLSSSFPKKEAVYVFITVFGALLYCYYMLHSVGTAYLNLSIPAGILLVWCSRPLFTPLSGQHKGMCAGVLALIVGVVLMINPSFVAYPNIFCRKQPPWSTLVSEYKLKSDLSIDARMIAELIPVGQKAAVISSYETRFCLEAKRMPMLYYVPVFRGSDLEGDGFNGTMMYTPDILKRNLFAIDANDPKYIFVESRILEKKLRPEIYGYSYSLRNFLNPIMQFFHPYRKGHYLTALRRNSS